jgi:hypothetical protein
VWQDIGLVVDSTIETKDTPPNPNTPLAPVLRCVLIGCEAVDMVAVCKATIQLTGDDKQKDKGAKSIPVEQTPEMSFCCCHNFCDTQGNIEILPLLQKSHAEELKKEVEKLEAGIKAYETDGVDKGYVKSKLANLCSCNQIVKLQQNLMQMAAVMKLKRGELELADEMGAAFMSGATHLQLHGFAACFTDMSDIVRTR